MRGIVTVAVLFAFFLGSEAQTYSLSGNLYDELARPLESGTVVLLNPLDSTMEYFAVSSSAGAFEIRNIREGKYLLQASFIGYQSFYSPLEFTGTKGPDAGDIVLMPRVEKLEGAQVVGEAVPLQISGDTVVYNAAAFKTRPDDMTEDLLKKLPGVEVDRAGNIRALGEDVKRLYVDGKEFFGADPKVATRNLPADAIERVKIYDKKSDATEFTGIDDGSRDKAVNLELKEDKKKGIFGDVLGGLGTDGHYKTSAKAYRFTDRLQLAAMGMLNNVNEYGFSFSDYLNFKGGIGSMMKGHGSARITLGEPGSIPVNYGQPVNGQVTSGAGGLNFSHSTSQHDRTYISYLVNGSDKFLDESSVTERHTGERSFTTETDREQFSGDMAHRVNFGMRRRMDSTHNLIVGGDVALMFSDMQSFGETENLEDNQLMSSLSSEDLNDADRVAGNLSATYFRMFGKNKSVLKLVASGGLSRDLDNTRSFSQTIPVSMDPDPLEQFLNRESDRWNLDLSAWFTQKIGKGLYLDPQLRMGSSSEQLNQDLSPRDMLPEPSGTLTTLFQKDYQWLRPGVSLRWNTQKSQLSAGFIGEIGRMETLMDATPYPVRNTAYFIPTLSWDFSPKSGRKINLSYRSSVNTPSVNQLLPVLNTLNPLSLYYGNPELSPEYGHNFLAHWLIFDQFSFTSLMMALSGTYTSDKINWSNFVGEDLVQLNTLANVDHDYRASFSLDFSTPVKKLGIKINLDAREEWNRGISLVNGDENTYTTFRQDYSLSAGNRKKKKWDVESGLGVALTNTSYDIRSELNSRYFDLSWFADLNYSPNDSWNFEFTSDITSYSDFGFEGSVRVPLLRAHVSYSFLRFKRGTFTLSAHDLLDRNQSVVRLSELNYMRETRTNTLGRYVMLSFKYRLNKVAREGGMEIKMKHR